MAEKKSNDRKEKGKKEHAPLKVFSSPKIKTSSIPAGCRACGGPYPLCKDGCALFDDD